MSSKDGGLGLDDYIRSLGPKEDKNNKRVGERMEVTPAHNDKLRDSKEPKDLEKAPTPVLYEQRSRVSLEEVEKVSPNFGEREKAEATPPPGRIKRLWAHIKRHWILYTIAALLLLLVILLLVFLVILPAIVQDIVNGNKLPVHSAGLTRPSPDHIDVSLQSELKVPSGIKVRMDPQTLGMYINDDSKLPFLELSLPEYHLKGKTNLAVVNQTRPILNQTEFTDFLTNALNTRNFTIFVRSKTTIHLGRLKYNVKINKGLKVAGLNKLAGFSVPSVELNNQGIIAHTIIPNASPFTIDLGNVTQNVYSGSTDLGTGVLENITLGSFTNKSYPLILNGLNINGALQNISQILNSQSGALAGGKIDLTSTNNSTIYDGQDITYIEQPLHALSLPISLDLQQVLQTLNVNLTGPTGSGNGTTVGGASGLGGLLGLLGNGSTLPDGLQGILQGIGGGGGDNLGNILGGLLGDAASNTGMTPTTKIGDLDDTTILEG